MEKENIINLRAKRSAVSQHKVARNRKKKQYDKDEHEI